MNIDNLREELQDTTDRLGKKIDEKIFDTVLYLNAHDLKTIGSCEGHLDRGLPFPWVDFSTVTDEQHSELNKLSDELESLLSKTDNNYDDPKVLEKKHERDHLINVLSKQNSLLFEKLLNLLEQFHEDRSVSEEVRLIITDRVTSFRLQPQGGILQKNRSEDEKEKYLDRYQEGINNFTIYLKDRI